MLLLGCAMRARLLSIMQGPQVGMLRSLFNYLDNGWLFAILYSSFQVFMMREILQLREVWSVIVTKNNPVSLILKMVAVGQLPDCSSFYKNCLVQFQQKPPVGSESKSGGLAVPG